MATTIFSPASRILSCSTTTTTTSPKPLPSPSKINQLPNTSTTGGHQIPKSPLHQVINYLTSTTTTTSLAATALATTAAIVLTNTPPSLSLALALEATDTTNNYSIYYGTAASASNYGGYGGNSDKKTSAEYIYDVPIGWKERLVSKVEKGTNGTDSEFYNPKKKSEKEYLTYLAGFRQLTPNKEAVLNNLALSDVNLQDLIASAERVTTEEVNNEGQVYYVYEIEGVGAHSLISVTCANNKLYAHFVNAPTPDWNRDQDTLRHLHHSFKTLV